LGNFKNDLKKWKEMEVKVMNILNTDWFNVIQNPIEKEMDLLIITEWVEVKHDEYAQYSWNFYIEFECNWKPSGLFREERVGLAYWAHSDWINVYLVNWKLLKEWVLNLISKCRDNKTNKHKCFRVVENWGDWGRTKGLLVPVGKLGEIAEKIYNI